jgi:threonine dehydratase
MPNADTLVQTKPNYADIQAAADLIRGKAHRTPVLTSRGADAIAGAELYFKAENLQRGGAFKFRGAYNAIARLSDAERRRGVFAFSSGNHAQGVAQSASLLGVEAVILMPQQAPAAKIEATRGYGAEVVTYDRFKEDRDTIAARISDERGLVPIPPYDHVDVIAGQGTVAVELFDEVGELDLLLVCMGGGGLLAGCAVAARTMSPDCKVIGVEPEAGNDGQQSFRKGEIVRIAPPRSIADGALTTHLGVHTFPIIRALVDDVVTVTDAQLIEAMKFFAGRMKLVVEPTGCLAAAAALSGVVPCAGKRVGIVISGGNVDLQAFGQFMAQ